ncbi:MAG: hypothetical protein AB9835_07815 [Eubacteriales bacterium]
MNIIKADFSKTTGLIKPMHGIGNAPLLGTSEHLFHYLGEAGIPYSRLHDTGGEYGCGRFVDIANIFRDFEADASDPSSYDFAFTDWLLAALDRQGVKPFYRLGATIENSHKIKAYNIYPPKDAHKWAQICEGIIRHYNEGWADGFRYGIEYWEIWNEPDNEPEIADNPMWKGTPEEYFHLYEVTSNHLKKCFPQLKIGGYASCGFYALSNADFSETAHSTSRVEYFVEFFHSFLKYITHPDYRSPFDFFSWHSYAGIADNVRYAKYARDTLDRYGFTQTESIFNEWNPGIDNRGLLRDAAYIAAMLCAMQRAHVDICMYYDGQVHSSYGGMFNPITKDVFKAYYAFKAFNELYMLGHEVHCEGEGQGVFALAATDGKECAVLLVNANEIDMEVKLDLAGVNTGGTPTVLSVDCEHDLTEHQSALRDGDTVVMSANVVMVVKTAI